MSPSKSLLKNARLLHLYCGVFTTPALIFFAFTGLMQTFSLHETTRGSDYKPPKILVELGQFHKKQTLVLPPPRPEQSASKLAGVQSLTLNSEKSGPTTRPDRIVPASSQEGSNAKADAIPRPAAPAASPGRKQNLWPMKIFFAVVAVSLFLSTLTGLYMSYKYVRNKALITISLVAGLIIPMLLTLF